MTKFIKLPTEILDDAVIGGLDDDQFRFYISLLLLKEKYGEIYSQDTVAWILRISVDKVEKLFSRLNNVGLTNDEDEPFVFECDKSDYEKARYEWMLIRKAISKIVYERDGRKCAFCESEDDLTIDHIVPLIQGGTHALDNLQVLCRKCNSSKGGK